MGPVPTKSPCLLLFYACAAETSLTATPLLRNAAMAPDTVKYIGALFPQVRLEVYPSPTCPNCLDMMRNGILPLVETGLFGDQVWLSTIPWVRGIHDDAKGIWESTSEPSAAYDQLCSMELCALRQANSSNPSRLDSKGLRRAVRFIVCHMTVAQHAGNGGTVAQMEADVRQCAFESGVPWANEEGVGLRDCSLGLGFDVQRSDALAAKINWVYKQRHWSNAPFLFLNGWPLLCSGSTYCTSVWTPDGELPLEKPGTLLQVICSLLHGPVPMACVDQVSSSTPTNTVTVTCEQCWDLGSFSLRGGTRDQQMPTSLLRLMVVAAFSVTAGAAVCRSCRGQTVVDECGFQPAE